MTKTEVLQECERLFGSVPGWLRDIPEKEIGPVWDVMKNIQLADTSLSPREKELISLAVASVLRCHYCAFFHAEAAKAAGATPDQIKEAAIMGGVVSLFSTYLNGTGYDLDTFKKETVKMIEGAKKQQPVAAR